MFLRLVLGSLTHMIRTPAYVVTAVPHFIPSGYYRRRYFVFVVSSIRSIGFWHVLSEPCAGGVVQLLWLLLLLLLFVLVLLSVLCCSGVALG